MIYPGDYKEPFVLRRALTFRWLRAEFKGGVSSSIPVCCVIYYLGVFTLHLLLRTIRVLNLAYPNGWAFFSEHQYHRCLICHLKNRISEPVWNGITNWTYYLGKER